MSVKNIAIDDSYYESRRDAAWASGHGPGYLAIGGLYVKGTAEMLSFDTRRPLPVRFEISCYRPESNDFDATTPTRVVVTEAPTAQECEFRGGTDAEVKAGVATDLRDDPTVAAWIRAIDRDRDDLTAAIRHAIAFEQRRAK